MHTIRLCNSCLGPVPPDAPEGLCPACLLKTEAGGTGDAPGGGTPRYPMPDEEFGGYKILRMLGRGGMGEVYEAEHLASGRRVALKVMSRTLASEKDRKRFLREGRLAAGVSHPNVVYIYGSEEISGSPVIAMELVSGGTLKDRIKHKGPLSPAQAVDATLEIIAGLEAAQNTGVLHRDIKPANCFVGSDGIVKVGDFGLSISTIARGESLLTASGSVLGTPAYASPEQLRGEDLDVASDIYSVGATLYNLLTGRPPHDAQDFVKLITEVLDKVPPSPDRLRPEIPAGLAKVVMRCLAKDRTKRFPGYAALRDALLPFSSTAPSPALLGLRFVAGLVDEFVVYVPGMWLLLWFGRDAVEFLLSERTTTAAICAIAFLLCDLLYYAIPEGLWGASVGKGICGLRVVGPNRGSAGVPRALLRALIFRVTWTIPILATVLLYTGAEYQARMTAGHWNPEDWLWFPLLALLFCTMRRRNGFAGLHDLASRTRVVARLAATERPVLVTAPPLAPSPASASNKIGPYEILGSLEPIGARDSLSHTGGEGQGEAFPVGELLLAHDPALRRNLWVHQQPSGAPPVTIRRRDISRATRLRWLNGERNNQVTWDAYEALDGSPLVNLPPQNWAAVRFWLHDLATEFAVGSNHDSLPPALQLDHVWITAANRAVILDFPCPGALGAPSSCRRVLSADSFAGAQKFLSAVAEYGLSKRAKNPLTAALSPSDGARDKTSSGPEPLHAKPFLRRLAEGRFESPEILVGNLQSLHGKMAAISRRRRASIITLALGPALVIAITAAATLWFGNKRTARNWPREFSGSTELRAELRAYESFGGRPVHAPKTLEDWVQNEDTGKEFRRALRKHMAGHHRELIENTNFWAHPVVAQALNTNLQRIAKEAVVDDPTVSPKRLEEADATVRYLLLAIQSADTELPQWISLGMFWAVIIFAALLDFACALIMGEGLFLRLLGIATVNRNGDKASRIRVLWRTILAWSPCGIGAPLSLALWLTLVPGLHVNFFVMIALGVMILLTLGTLAWAIWRPARGLQDIAAGTWLVPR